ncbi:MAG: response regulator [Chloroflexi bacterium]|nr:response regulator [Chloroflexota bacterium]
MAVNPGTAGGGLVLVVDDDDMVRLLAGRALERGGLTPILARNGREALDIYRAQACEIALVLMDMTMPEMDGEETFRALRAIDPGVRVVVSSGYSEQDTTARFAEACPAGYIQKPYRIDELLAKVDAVMRSAPA